jgi:signal transduction histidine kinase
VAIWLNWTKAGFSLLAVLAAFWVALYLGESAVRPAGMTPPPSLAFVPVDAAGNPLPGAKPRQANYYENPIYRALVDESGPRVEFLIPFEARHNVDDLAFYLGATPGLQQITLNGTVIQPNIPLDTLRGASDGTALYYVMPPALLRDGDNLIEVLVETQSSVLALAPFHIGPAVEAARAAAAVDLITDIIPIIAISVLAFATLLCLVTNWPTEDRARIRSLMLLMGVWGLRTYFISFQTPIEVPFLITAFLYYLLDFSIIIAFARHLLAGEAGTERWQKWLGWLWGLLFAYLAVVTATGFAVGPAIMPWFEYLAMGNAGMLLMLALGGLAVLSWGAAVRRDGRWLERLTLMFCLLALSVDAADAAFDLALPFARDLALTFYAAAPAGLLLGLGVVASIAREASEARRTVVRSNEILAAQLTEQTAKLERSYDAQKQMLQREVMLVERQRIVRDMHDGIGGQLLGLMMQVRSGGASPVEVEQGLQASIADLRLIVDSMDSAEDGLAKTLQSFEHRVRSQIEAAGIALDFVSEVDEAIDLGPRPTLQVLRILQEAVTNALRHSGARRIAVRGSAPTRGPIRIVIEDDGSGLPEGYRRGRGLTSMETRARNLGGVFAIHSGPEGTRLTLEVPVINFDAAD